MSNQERGATRAGCLYVVATPIGNLGDMSERALRVLGQVTLIAAEDTRHSMPLLRHFHIDTPMQAYHEHNEREMTPRLVERLLGGEDLALISDAGTPLISDPGFHLVRAARDAGVTVSPVPGASSLIAALSVAGMPTDRFVFEGFPPSRPNARRKRFEELRGESRTLVLLESSHRVAESLADMRDVFGGDRVAVLARELTKTYETIRKAGLAELAAWVRADADQQRGEFVILIAGAEVDVDASQAEGERIMARLLTELPARKAAGIAAELSGANKNALYRWAIDQNGE